MDTKEQLKLINKEIEEKTYQKDLIQSIESDLISLNKNIKNCISLIAASVKGKKANEIINNLTEENKRLTDQCNHTILEDKTKITNHLEELNNNQIILQEKLKKEEEDKKDKEENN